MLLDGIRRGTRLQEQSHTLRLVLAASSVQGSAAITVGKIRIRTSGEQKSSGLELPSAAGKQESSVAVLCRLLVYRVSSCEEQLPQLLHAAVHGGLAQLTHRMT